MGHSRIILSAAIAVLGIAWTAGRVIGGRRCAGFQSRHPADPGRQMLRLPRARFGHAEGRPAARHRRRALTSRRSCRAMPIRASSFAESRATTRKSGCRRPQSKKPPLTQGADRARSEVDQGGREVRAALGVHSAAATSRAASEADGLAAQRHRSLPAREARSAERRTRAGGRSGDARPPIVFRSDRPAADADAGATKFVKDTAPDAYEKLVDQLLASPAFGERMATWWFDLVRFADTVGYHGDQDHRITPYRDYVIKSFQRQSAVRPVHDRAIGRRLAAESDDVAARGHRLQPPAANDARRRCTGRRVSGDHAGRPRAEFLGNVDGGLDGLRAVPRSQVRSRTRRKIFTACRRSSPTSTTTARSRPSAATICRRSGRPRCWRGRCPSTKRCKRSTPRSRARRSCARRSDQRGLGEASRRADQAQEGAARARSAVRADDDHEGGDAARDSHPAARQLDGQVRQGRPAARAALS